MAQIPLATAADLSAHTGDTTGVHGIPDTAALVTTDDTRLSDARTPTDHATTHASGGSDALKLDDLAAPDDNTDLNATTSHHGLLPKLGGGTTNFLRADGTWAAPAGGGAGGPATEITETSGPTDLSIGAIASGQMLVRSGDTVVGQDVPSGTGAIGPEPGITADAQYVLGAATVTPGSTALSVTGGTFAAGDVGKLIVVSRHRQVTDAAITSGDATLTSATAAFTADDVGAEVVVSGAGTTGKSLVTTIASVTDASTVELALAASTTVSGKVATIGAQHATTIAAYTSATAVTLTAAATPGFTNADVAWGTDQRSALSTAAAACASAGRMLRLPRGKVFVAIDSTNQWGTTNLTSSLAVTGYGVTDTEVVVVHNASNSPSSFEGGLFRVNSAELLSVSDLSARYVSLPHEYAERSPALAVHAGSNTTLNRLEGRHVTARGFGHGFQLAGGNTAASRVRLSWIDLQGWGTQVTHFRDSTSGGGTDHENTLRHVALRQMAKQTTSSLDTAYNAHMIYIHPNVWVDWDDVSTQQDQTGMTAYVLHNFGSPSAIPKAISRIRGLRTAGGGYGLYTSASFSGNQRARFHVSESALLHSGPGISLGGPAHVQDCQFSGGGDAIYPTTPSATTYATTRVERCIFPVSATADAVMPGWDGSVWEIVDCSFLLNNTVSDTYAFNLQSPGSGKRYRVRIQNPKLYGETGNTKAWGINLQPTADLTWEGGSCEGTIPGVIGGSAITTDDSVPVHFEDVRFSQSGPLIPSNIGIRKGNLTGRGCTFATVAAMPNLVSSGACAFVPRLGTSGTSLTVASNTLYLGTIPFAAFDVTGGGTVNNIYAGDSSNVRQRVYGGDLVLRANGAALTLAHNAGGTGNLRAKALADRTVADGESIRLRHDERAGIWYEV